MPSQLIPLDIEFLPDNMYDRYSYNEEKSLLRFYVPSWIHASSVEWIKQWVDSMKTSGDVEPSGIKVYNDVTLSFDGVTG